MVSKSWTLWFHNFWHWKLVTDYPSFLQRLKKAHWPFWELPDFCPEPSSNNLATTKKFAQASLPAEWPANITDEEDRHLWGTWRLIHFKGTNQCNVCHHFCHQHLCHHFCYQFSQWTQKMDLHQYLLEYFCLILLKIWKKKHHITPINTCHSKNMYHVIKSVCVLKDCSLVRPIMYFLPWSF